MGLLLILIFNVNLGWLPGSGAYDPGQSGNLVNRIEHMVLPVTVMIAIVTSWYYAYMIRNKLLDEVRQDYFYLAKMKGLSRLQVLCRHCLRNVWPTIISIIGCVGQSHHRRHLCRGSGLFLSGLGLSIESAKYHDYNRYAHRLITGMIVIASVL